MNEKESNKNPILHLRNIELSYGRMTVLDKLDFGLNRGEIHALLGEHGAGKSSVSKIISGFTAPNKGEIVIEGKSYPSLPLRLAKRERIRMVYQEYATNDFFTVGENLFYADKRLPFISWRHKSLMLEKAREFVAAHGFEINVKEETRNLNLSDRTIVEFLANLTEDPKILILDESIEKIAAADLPRVIDILRDLKNKGCSTLIITHKVEGIYDLADRISIIREGKVFYSEEVPYTNKIQLIKMAYTQMAEVDYAKDQYHIFHQLIKYNEAILVNLPVNLMIMDIHGNIQMLNRFCRKSFGFNQEDYIGRQLEDLFKDTSQTVLNMIRNAANSFKETLFYQLELLVNGRQGIFNLRFFPVMDDGFIIGSILLLEDITEYILDQRKDFLSDSLASIGLLAASVAHEVNNPMEIVYSYLTNIRFKYNNKELLKIVGALETELDYITHIIGSLQNFSMNEKTVAEETEVNTQIMEIMRLLQPGLRKRNIEVSFDTHNSDYFIMINKNELKQVFLNLFRNSMEAMSEGGVIGIHTSKLFAGPKTNLKIVFSDTGTGIEESRNLFAPFYSTKDQDRQNSGLGLSVCYSIIRKYKGSIALNNLRTRGCETVIILPLM